MSRDMTKRTKWLCAQRKLRSALASALSDQSSLCAKWVAKDSSFLHADSEDSDQTGRMTRLIWVFAGRTLILLVLSCRGSYPDITTLNYSHSWFGLDMKQLLAYTGALWVYFWNLKHIVLTDWRPALVLKWFTVVFQTDRFQFNSALYFQKPCGL